MINKHHSKSEKPEPKEDELIPTYIRRREWHPLCNWVGGESTEKHFLKSSHPLRDDLQLCLWDLLDDGDEGPSKSKELLEIVGRGGLCRVNNITY